MESHAGPVLLNPVRLLYTAGSQCHGQGRTAKHSLTHSLSLSLSLFLFLHFPAHVVSLTVHATSLFLSSLPFLCSLISNLQTSPVPLFTSLVPPTCFLSLLSPFHLPSLSSLLFNAFSSLLSSLSFCPL